MSHFIPCLPGLLFTCPQAIFCYKFEAFPQLNQLCDEQAAVRWPWLTEWKKSQLSEWAGCLSDLIDFSQLMSHAYASAGLRLSLRFFDQKLSWNQCGATSWGNHTTEQGAMSYHPGKFNCFPWNLHGQAIFVQSWTSSIGHWMQLPVSLSQEVTTKLISIKVLVLIFQANRISFSCKSLIVCDTQLSKVPNKQLQRSEG